MRAIISIIRDQQSHSTGKQSSMNPGGLTKRLPSLRAVLRIALLLIVCSEARAQTEATTIPLIYPTSIVFDANGVLYLAETGRHVVDRLDSSGNLTVVAGDGTQGFSGDGGTATAAQLDSPQGLTVDGQGNVYLADTHNHRIRMVTATTGVITTIAGTGSPGYSGDSGAATDARLTLPTAVALDSAGNLYIADSGNQRIRKVALASGTITTFAGNGTQGGAGDLGLATSASLDMPSGLATNAAGDLYLADRHNQRIRRVAHDTGIISTLAPTTLFRLPRGLSADSAGNIYVAATGDNRVLRIAPDGTVSAPAGTGNEGFYGDNGPATSALLDRPRATGVSPSGLLTLADTGNQRIRQVDAAGVIHTLGGVGLVSSTLSLNAPDTVAYGSGTVLASLSGTTPASGAISFLEVTNGSTTLLGSGTLASNVATFSTANLAAGAHHLLATYTGDATHASAGSNTSLLKVTQAPVTAVPVPATVLYGLAIPVLTGTVNGILPQDMSIVSAVFTSAARVLSAPGGYPIGLVLSGMAAANYQVSVAPASVTILQAPTSTAVASTVNGATVGTAMTLSATAASTTQGVPSGELTFFDAGAVIGTAVANAAGVAAMATTLASGTHSITAAYSGDRNFLASVSPAITEVISPVAGNPPDFTLAASGAPSQTALGGTAASFAFNVSIQNGPLNSPILLTASGMPPGATATFSPTYLPPGGGVSAFTLSVQTVKATAETMRRTVWWGALVCGLMVLPSRRRRVLRGRLVLMLGLLLMGSIVLEGCGDRVAQVPAATTASAASYPMTVTATSTLPGGSTLQHTATVTLIVQ